ncbi:MFS transporter, partial [Escherichia coli]
PLTLNQSNSKANIINGTFWLLFKGEMLRRTLVAITVLIAMNISLYTITVWIPTIFVNSGIDIDKSILMTAVIMIGAPVGIFIAALIIDHFPRRLFGSALLIIIAVLGYIYSIQTTEWAILIYGLVMIFFLYMYVCFASAALLTHYGSITVFMVLGVMLVLCALVLSIFGIETRKVSLEEISEVN